MSELDLSRILPGWTAEGVLGSDVFGTKYLVRSTDTGAFSALKVIRVPPARESIDNAVKMGIGRDLLTTYFNKFKNDLSWELTMYRTVASQHLAPVEELVTVDADGPGWTGYIRTGIYTPMSVYFAKAASTPEDAARLGSELASALDALSQYGMVHGEIKPDNVMVTDAGSFILSDYGIRRCLERAGSGIFDVPDDEFEAPEVGEGESRKYTQSSDIYSLGALMCYVANGCSMPQNRDPSLIKGITPELSGIIKKCLSADPEQRYESAKHLRNDLSKLGPANRQPRRAMAAVAAFDAVKRNGGAVTAQPAGEKPTAKSQSAKQQAKNQTAKSGGPKQPSAKEQTVRDAPAKEPGAKPSPAKAPDKSAAKPSAQDLTSQPSPKTGEADREPRRTETAGPRRSWVGFIIAGVTILAIIAVVAAIWLPGRDDGGKNGGDGYVSNVHPAGDGDGDGTEPNGGGTGTPDDGSGNDGSGTTTPGPDDGTGGDGSGTEPGDGGDDTDPGTDPGPGGGGDVGGDTQTPGGEDGGKQDDGKDGQDDGDDGQGDGETGPGTDNPNPTTQDAYLYPSDTVRITREELEGKTREETSMLINEIYARHGLIFSNGGTIQKYFEAQSWYKPTTWDDAEAEKEFNAVETANIKTLTDYQREMGWRGQTQNQQPEKADPEPPPENPNPPADYYIFPSDTTLITKEDLDPLGRDDIIYILNEIYARHGYIFKTDSLREYFESQAWYKPVSNNEALVKANFNDTENQNVDFINQYLRDKGWR